MGPRTHVLGWWSVAAAAAAGTAMARWAGLLPAWAGPLAALCWGLLAPLPGRYRALSGLALVHGLLAGQAAVFATIPTPRGAVFGVYEARALGPSEPGPTCQVPVAIGGRGPFLADLPAQVCPLADGDRLRLVGVTHRVAPRDPDGPDPSVFAARKGCIGRVAARHAFVRRTGRGPAAALAAFRSRLARAALGDPGRAFVAASVFGLPRLVPPEARATLRTAGLGHLVAVSGLHVGLCAGLFFGLIARIVPAADPRVPWLAATLPMAAYAWAVGGSPPAVRAAVMVAVPVLAASVGIRVRPTANLAIAAGTMLLVRPGWSLDPGFHLTLAAAAAIVTGPPGASQAAVTWRVTWAVAPVAAWHFGDASFRGIVANLVAIPVFAHLVLPLGLLGALPGTAGEAAAEAASWGGAAILDLSAVAGRMPMPPPGLLLAAAAGSWLLSRIGRLRLVRAPVPAVAAWAACMVRPPDRPDAPATGWVAHGRARPYVVHLQGPEGSACVPWGVPMPPQVGRFLARHGSVARRRACPVGGPSTPEVRRWLRRCGRDVRWVRSDGGRLACFRRGRWIRLEVGAAEAGAVAAAGPTGTPPGAGRGHVPAVRAQPLRRGRVP